MYQHVIEGGKSVDCRSVSAISYLKPRGPFFINAPSKQSLLRSSSTSVMSLLFIFSRSLSSTSSGTRSTSCVGSRGILNRSLGEALAFLPLGLPDTTSQHVVTKPLMIRFLSSAQATSSTDTTKLH